ncbi:hypothetical protein [Bradyrhizobium sp. DASA03120]
MPIIRYFLFVGSLLVALLFLADFLFPAPPERSAGIDVDRSIIRIHSARVLPERIVFDTSAAPVHPREASSREAKNETATVAKRAAHIASIADQVRVPSQAAQ